jgi:TRAP-type C4-dicarboxylate transport system permease small subunit
MPKIFETLDKIRPAYELTDKIVMFLCKILLIADICISGYAVCGRLIGGIEVGGGYIRDFVPFLKDPAWTEEVVLTLMSYMAVLSAALAIRHEKHIRMDAFDAFLPAKVKLVLDILADVAVLALGLIMLVVGWQYASTIGARGTYVSMMWLSRFWMYFPIPLAGFAMIIFEIERILEHLKKAFVKEDANV